MKKRKLKLVLLTLNVLLCTIAIGQADDLDVYSGAVTIDQNYVQVNVYNDAEVNMYEYCIDYLDTYNSSVFNLAGSGRIAYGLVVRDTSFFNMSGGEINRINVYDSSIIDLCNGDVGWLVTEVSSVATVNLSGGVIEWLDVPGSTINIFGYGFEKNPLSGTGDSILTGYWEDGSAFEMRLRRDQVSPLDNIILHVIPEPASILLLTLGSFYLRRCFTR